MTNHALLDNVTHKDLKVLPGYRRGEGFDVSTVRVFPVEFGELQMEYPIVLTRNNESGHFEPVVLLGLAEKENLFLDDKGWDAHYIPLAIERQPFLIGFQETMDAGVPQRQPVVHIDMDHPKVSMTEGDPVFLQHGGESPFLERISSVLMAIHQGNELNQSFSKLLVGLDLVESSSMQFTLANGEKHTLTGLHIINEDRLLELSGDALAALHQKGFLKSVYMMLASLPNFRKLIDRKNALLESRVDEAK
jgi:hypothetical protein